VIAGRALPGDRDLDGGADPQAGRIEDVPSRVQHGDGEHRGKTDVLVDNDLLDVALRQVVELRPVDADPGRDRVGGRAHEPTRDSTAASLSDGRRSLVPFG